MKMKVGVFCPTLNVYGGGEFVAIAIANTLAQNHHNVVLFTDNEVNPQAIENFFGERTRGVYIGSLFSFKNTQEFKWTLPLILEKTDVKRFVIIGPGPHAALIKKA